MMYYCLVWDITNYLDIFIRTNTKWSDIKFKDKFKNQQVNTKTCAYREMTLKLVHLIDGIVDHHFTW